MLNLPLISMHVLCMLIDLHSCLLQSPPGGAGSFSKKLVTWPKISTYTQLNECMIRRGTTVSMIDCWIHSWSKSRQCKPNGLPVVLKKFSEPFIRIIRWDHHGSIAGWMQCRLNKEQACTHACITCIPFINEDVDENTYNQYKYVTWNHFSTVLNMDFVRKTALVWVPPLTVTVVYIYLLRLMANAACINHWHQHAFHVRMHALEMHLDFTWQHDGHHTIVAEKLLETVTSLSAIIQIHLHLRQVFGQWSIRSLQIGLDVFKFGQKPWGWGVIQSSDTHAAWI